MQHERLDLVVNDPIYRREQKPDFKPGPAPKTVVGERNFSICGNCRDSLRDVCIEKCQPEGRYRHLRLKPVEEWLAPPSLPSYEKFLEWTPSERQAMFYVISTYVLSVIKSE